MSLNIWNLRTRVRGLALTLACALLSGCQTPATVQAPGAMTLEQLFPGWHPAPVLGKRWQPFESVEQDGQPGMAVQTEASLSLLRTHFSPPVKEPSLVEFSWWVQDLVDGADLSDSQASDAPAQLAVAFDGDRSALSARFGMMSELTLLVTGDPLPYASLVYVWATGDEHPVGTVIRDPRTDRIRYLVVEQGPAHLRRWVRHTRDVHADYRQVFNEEPGPILGLALMSDADNTRGRTRAVFGPVRLMPR